LRIFASTNGEQQNTFRRDWVRKRKKNQAFGHKNLKGGDTVRDLGI
jgi:hypothetical protein